MTEFPFWQQLVIAVAGAFLLAAPTIYFGWRDRKKVSAERHALQGQGIKSLTEAATDVVELLEPYKKEVREVHAELETQKHRRMDAEQELRKLEVEMRRIRTTLDGLQNRVSLLEWWIKMNTDIDPAEIRGET